MKQPGTIPSDSPSELPSQLDIANAKLGYVKKQLTKALTRIHDLEAENKKLRLDIHFLKVEIERRLRVEMSDLDVAYAAGREAGYKAAEREQGNA